jgi:hypothetical protein
MSESINYNYNEEIYNRIISKLRDLSFDQVFSNSGDYENARNFVNSQRLKTSERIAFLFFDRETTYGTEDLNKDLCSTPVKYKLLGQFKTHNGEYYGVIRYSLLTKHYEPNKNSNKLY